MKYSKKTSKKTKTNLPITVLVVVLAVALVLAGGWYLLYRDPAPDITSSTPADDPNFSEGGERDPGTESTPRDGGVVDTSGEDAETEHQGDGISSSSGKITVYQPMEDTILKDGSTLSGTAKVSIVHYRLMDDKIGVIGTGSLKVVNGKFSGKFSFSSGGREGRLDVFNQLSDDREVDVVEIPVRFK